MMPAPLFAAAIVSTTLLIGGSLEYSPQTLLLKWPGGHEERIAATSPATCAAAVRAIERGLWRPGDVEPLSATCGPGNLFPARSLCIASYNCGGRR